MQKISRIPRFIKDLERKRPRNSRELLEFIGATIAIVFFVIAGLILIWFATLDVPSITAFHTRRVPESTKLYDRTGKILLYDVHGSIRRTKVPITEVSKDIQNATIAIEDPNFYKHGGIIPKAILRAVVADVLIHLHIQKGYTQGGSTITQQVVKNTLLTTDKTITRKVKEWILAIKLERAFTKDQILEVYFNETPYGGTLYGVEEAAQAFFGKPAKEVDLAEAAYLAAIPQAPTYYSPFGNHRDALEARKNLVLSKMLAEGMITQAQAEEAKKEKITFLNQSNTGIKAPHFVFFIREYLESKYGADAVSNGGLKVITTLDYSLQAQAEDIVHSYALKNAKAYNASNASLVATDPKTGQILTMVGSRDYFDPAIDGKFNVATANRQPGSAFKPFVYATAFAKGYTPNTMVFDLKTQFSTLCDPRDVLNDTAPCYSPDNYDDKFLGPISLKDALAQSRNVPAVKVLYLAGLKDSLATAQKMGISTLLDASHYGSSLVLGGGEVSLLEMTSAYGVFANNGVRHPYTGILSVEDNDGEVLESYKEEPGTQVLDTAVTAQIADVLSDDVARIPEFGAHSALYVPGHTVAVKTGTTNDYRDTWIVGYTPAIAVGAWAGNNDNSPMEKKIAGFIVAPMWNEFMRVALASSSDETFPPPPPEDPNLKPVMRGVWNQNGVVHDILHWVNKANPLGPPPTNPASDGQYVYWEFPVQVWLEQGGNGMLGSTTPIFDIPLPGLPNPTPGYTSPSFNIKSPHEGETVRVGSLVTVYVDGSALSDTQRVTYYVNGISMGASTKAPFSLSFVPQEAGPMVIRAEADGGGRYSAQISVVAE